MFQEKPLTPNMGRPKKPVYGVGINDATYATAYKDATGKSIICPYYRAWTSMLERCFSEKFHKSRPNYAGCSLEESWKTFSVFKAWMEKQDWKGKHLDKDLLSHDNKHYGPSTCLFISRELNNLLCLRKNHQGEFPLGVSRAIINGSTYFVASCSFYGKQKKLGYFKTPEAAADAYKKAKLNYIAKLAEKETDPRIKQALLNLW